MNTASPMGLNVGLQNYKFCHLVPHKITSVEI